MKDPSNSRPLRRPALEHRAAMTLASDEYHLFADAVADVVAEWASRHGRPYRLTLTGPAGGEWGAGTGGEELELDAVEFCRVLSGRGEGTGLLATAVPF